MWFKKKTNSIEDGVVEEDVREEIGHVAQEIINLFKNGGVKNEFTDPGAKYSYIFKFNDLTIKFDYLIGSTPKFYNMNGVELPFITVGLNYTEVKAIEQAMVDLWRKNKINAWVEAIKSTRV